MKKNKTKKAIPLINLITLTEKDSPISEQFRTIRTNIQFAASVDHEIKTIVITSSGPGEGKSTSAANLAVVFASSGQRVLLVDADLRKPTVSRTFALSNLSGLSNLLSSYLRIDEVVNANIIPNLSVITSGPKPPNPSELLGSVRMDTLMKEMRRAYDIVIFDMPPLLAVTDAQLISAKADGTLLVVRERISKKSAAIKAKELLTMASANVLGVIYNGAKNAEQSGYFYYYGQ